MKQGRVPGRIRNLNEFPVHLGRNQKLGGLYQVDKADVRGTRDASLMPDADGAVEVGVVETSKETGQDPTFDLKGLTEGSDLTTEQQRKLTALLQK